MLREIKSLVTISQETLARHLDVLDDVGSTPYSLLKPALRKATPKQLLRIEKANPHLVPESDELWLQHCLSFTDIREAYRQGEYQDSSKWRKTYMKRFKEAEHKREMISAKIKKQYTQLQNERAARSIKVLHGHVPTQGRGSSTYESARRSKTSKLFQETRRAADRTHAMYQKPQKQIRPVSAISSASVVEVSKPTSTLSKAYSNLRQQRLSPPRQPYQPLVPPPSRIEPRWPEKKPPMMPPSPSASMTKRRRLDEPARPRGSTSTGNKSVGKRPAALVNYDIFKQLS
ncbi:RNA polymerase II transcription factor SIII subunit A-domain-containing protein [Fennellomyces sp. T-0311]|nr:RNA polymerase II transcription factor SIII subunit A-domain-containing protein [Fennellomyces sp. T-0311]